MDDSGSTDLDFDLDGVDGLGFGEGVEFEVSVVRLRD